MVNNLYKEYYLLHHFIIYKCEMLYFTYFIFYINIYIIMNLVQNLIYQIIYNPIN